MGDERERSNPLSVFERIRDSSPLQLGVSLGELEMEMTKLAEQGDRKMLKQIYDAYATKEVVNMKSGEDPNDVVTRAMENFDFVARAADARTVAKSDVVALSLAKAPYPHVGKIQQFFRDTVGYNPPPQKAPEK